MVFNKNLCFQNESIFSGVTNDSDTHMSNQNKVLGKISVYFNVLNFRFYIFL